MAADKYLLGIDAGTSVVKAGLFDRQGREVATAQRRTSVHVSQPGWSEAGMNATWAAAVEAIGEALAAAGACGDDVAAVGVSGNMIGAWLVDAQGQPVRDAILWNDGRTRALFEQLSAQHDGFMTRVFNSSGSVLEHGCTLPVVRWLADHEPRSLDRAAAILHSKDWIRFKLTGAIHTDTSEVPGLPGDARARDYSEAMFALFGIARYRHLFPEHVPSHSIVGEVLPETAAATGLNAGTPVVAGAGDVPAVALGVGAVTPGIALTILGTHCISGIVLDRPSFEPANVGLLFYIPNNRWMRAMTNVAGTTNLDWFMREFWSDERASAGLFAALEALAAESGPGARGVLYHPYLSAVGIIAPFFEPAARAQFFGLTREHTRGDMLRAIYEGLALAIRDLYTEMGAPLDELRLSGGGARSRLWAQIIADCLGVRVLVPAGTEFGAKGAALLAGVGLGWFGSVGEAASQTLRLERAHEPNPALRPLYDENYVLYRDLRNTLRPLWQQAARRSFLSGQTG